MTEGWVQLDSFLSARLAERAADAALDGNTMAGHAAGLHVNVLAVHIEIVKALPLPRWIRTRLLERIARREFGDHPAFSEWWR